MSFNLLKMVAYLHDAASGRQEKQRDIPRLSDLLAAVKRYENEYRGNLLGYNYRSLDDAIDHALRSGAILVLPNFNAISRLSKALDQLRDSGLEFVALDNPHANRSSLPLLASIVGDEARLASQKSVTAKIKRKRTRARHGTKGIFNEKSRLKGSDKIHRRALSQAKEIGPRLRELRDQGKTLREIASIVEKEGSWPKPGVKLTHTHIRRALHRYELIAQ